MWRLHVANILRRMARRLSDDMVPRGEPGSRGGNGGNVDGKNEGGGDGIGNEDEDQNGHKDGYEELALPPCVARSGQ